jgi:hypothetical protein
MNTKLSIRLFALLLASTFATAAGVSCSSSSTGGTGGLGAGGSTIVTGPASSSSSTTSSGSTTGSTTSSSSGGSSTSSSSGAGCTDADAGNCYSCPPATNDEFLNACNGQVCVPYDNSATNLPMLTADGGLPPITM